MSECQAFQTKNKKECALPSGHVGPHIAFGNESEDVEAWLIDTKWVEEKDSGGESDA